MLQLGGLKVGPGDYINLRLAPGPIWSLSSVRQMSAETESVLPCRDALRRIEECTGLGHQ